MKTAMAVLVTFLLSLPAAAQQIHVCWVEAIVDPDSGRPSNVTRCRVAGEIVDYATEFEVPLRLFAAVGSASNGTCWYWRSVWTG